MPYLFYTCNVKLSTKLISVLWEYFLNNQWMSYFLKQCLNPKPTSIVVVESVFLFFITFTASAEKYLLTLDLETSVLVTTLVQHLKQCELTPFIFCEQ